MKEYLTLIEEREVLGKQFRMYGTIENPYFVAADVATWIGHTNTATMLNGIDEDEKLIETLFISGQRRDCWMLTEQGLYEVLMQSRKPIAKQFKKQVKQILITIRKTGQFSVNVPTGKNLIAIALIEANKIIEEQKPKVAVHTSIKTAERTAEIMLDWAKMAIKELVDKDDYKSKYEIFAYCAKAAGLTDFPIPNYTAELLYKQDLPPSVQGIFMRLDSMVKTENMLYSRMYKEIVAQYGSSHNIKKNSFWKYVLQWADTKGYTVRFSRSNGDKKITFVDSNGYVVLGTEEKGATIC